MPAKKIIAVVGATGAQGGALIQAIVKEGENSEFAVRAITRNASSEKALALKKLPNVEVVEADVNNEESLVKAFDGCYGAFCVTFFWEHLSPAKELEQAKIMASAAKKTGIKHVIWSTLEDTRKSIPADGKTMPKLMDKYNVPHFDAKGEADALFADVPTTYLLTSAFMENNIYFGWGPKKAADGKYYINIPMGDKKMAIISTVDIGKCALGIFKHPEYINKRVAIAGDALTVDEVAKTMTKVLGTEVLANKLSFDAYRKFGFPGAEELGNMFQYYHDCEAEFLGRRNLEEVRKLNPELMNFESWLVKNKEYIPIDI